MEVGVILQSGRKAQRLYFIVVFVFSIHAFAQKSQAQPYQDAPFNHHEHDMPMNEQRHPLGPQDCPDMQIWDYSFGSCSPFTMPDMPMSMAMIHGNAFLVGIAQEGSRGREAIAAPNMIMGDFGKSVGDRHYFNVNLMLTAEKWTFPKDGYPELLQIGEEKDDGSPYIDSQHPHSSPIMGLTFSDSIWLGQQKDHLKIFFAPRGQATEGPTAFMHRPTGMVNPDAPLGHHIGQDVSHITSTVIGASLGLGRSRFEASTFHGAEPEPTKVDLPLGTPNSYAGRIIYEISDNYTIMGSAAFVKEPELHDPDLEKIWRYSTSFYNRHELGSGWNLHNTFIFGLVNGYDHVSVLRSFLDEFWIHSHRPSQFWGRIEFVERAPAQLAISGVANPLEPRWVTALTLGYTHRLASISEAELSLGASATKYFLPSEFGAAYGGDPLGGKIFLQLGGMKMFERN